MYGLGTAWKENNKTFRYKLIVSAFGYVGRDLGMSTAFGTYFYQDLIVDSPGLISRYIVIPSGLMGPRTVEKIMGILWGIEFENCFRVNSSSRAPNFYRSST
jgi:hypothetical protein